MLLRFKKPVWRIVPAVFAPRSADAADAGPLSEGQMTGNLQGDTNILEPPSAAGKPFPSLL